MKKKPLSIMSTVITNLNSLLHRNRRKVIDEFYEIIHFRPREWLNAFQRIPSYPLLQKGDLDGFVALFINNLATLLAVVLSLQPILGNEIVYGKIMPG